MNGHPKKSSRSKSGGEAKAYVDPCVSEPILDPTRPIIDPHHHLWDWRRFVAGMRPQCAYDNVLHRTPRYLLDELLADLESGHDIRATVHLECGSMYRGSGATEMTPVGETEFVNGIAAMGASGTYGDRRPCAGIVGYADLTLGSRAAAVLEAHMAAGAGRFRGIRQSASYDADPDVLGYPSRRPQRLYRDAQFRAGFRSLAPLNLSFDAWLLDPQLPDLIDLARAFPDSPICLNHVGTPLGYGSYAGKRKDRFDIWRANIEALSECQNIYVKLGGLGMHYSGFPSLMAEPPASSVQLAEEWRPYIETCIEAFSPSRAMFESNFPVDALTCSYATLWNAFKRITASYSSAEKHELFFGAAARFYRLQV
ncbi:Predicted metal-dependent hydrolase, TIM-barrel fold [Bradyrhizobium sp. Ghvi]|uniref:amidohydrolase family protein n=1 Tax=Bradyrhizobium sp. Ghvi TaxID=1855319 RepID=UPI0008E0F739|nr:amidohydrolase family protein [Bradyrhizobium sp. Ghvi]SFQ25152.1 Predicted metal-dependent hydrolase, TIM-barrel fold [Bradyrhizobium sp. Ghvi]